MLFRREKGIKPFPTRDILTCCCSSKKRGYAGKAWLVMGKISSNGGMFRNGHQILACCMILCEALNAALFLHLFSIGKMETRAQTANASINSAGFGQCLYTPVMGAGYTLWVDSLFSGFMSFWLYTDSRGDRLVFQTGVANKGHTWQAWELHLQLYVRRARKALQESSSCFSSKCQESKPDKGKVGFLPRGSSDLSLAVKKLKLIGLFMNSAF